MRKTCISIAVLSALAMGSAAPLFAQGANDDPSKQPPAGGRIPAAADTPQHSGDTASDQPSGSDSVPAQARQNENAQGSMPRARDQRSHQEKWQTYEQLNGQRGNPGAQYRHEDMRQRWNDPQQMGWGQEGRTS